MNRHERAKAQQEQDAWDAANLTAILASPAFTVTPGGLMGQPGTNVTATRDDWRRLTYYLMSELGILHELATERANQALEQALEKEQGR